MSEIQANVVNEEVAASKQKGAAADEQQVKDNNAVTAQQEITEGEQESKVGLLSSLMNNKSVAVTNRGNQLDATADLTRLSTIVASELMSKIDSNPDLADKFVASQKSHDAMDDLIGELYTFHPEEFLLEVGEEELEKMLRSQQSKRSRAKSKELTIEVYKTMMIAAIAEGLIRQALGKPKNYGGGATSDLGMSDEDYEALAADPEELKKAIRNVQSKKSIMKSKADFSEESPRWQLLLDQEARLKAIRDKSTHVVDTSIKQELEAKKEADNMLKELPALEELSEEDAKAYLERLKDILATKSDH